MTFSQNGIERLNLLQQHRQENNQFWDVERSRRQELTHQQQQEVREQFTSEVNSKIRVDILRRHTSESMELRALSDERRKRLCDQHRQELDDLTKRQNRNKALTNSEKTLD